MARPAERAARLAALAALGGLAVCLVCVLAFAAGQAWMAGPWAPAWPIMDLCLGRRGPSTELSFVSPFISSYAPPPGAACAHVPWATYLPQGKWVFQIP